VADLKISQLTALVAAGVDSAADVLPIVDSSAAETKKITVANLKTAVAPDLSTYAPLASPTFTGTPTLPTGTIATTQTAGDSTTKVATTAFVTDADNLKANLASPTFTGTPSLPTGTTGVTQSPGNNSTKLATTAYADAAATAAASAATLDNLSDVTITSVSSGQLLSYNGSAWVNSAPVAAFNPVEAAVFM